MKIKVCGVTERAEVELLGRCGVDGAGLWHWVAGGDAELSRSAFARRAADARACEVEPVLVTFAADPEGVCALARACAIKYVQLHAYQLPKVVAALRRPGLHLVKVLHVRGGRCVEERLIDAYERAGVDSFLLDVTSYDGSVGSTGETLPPAVAARLADRLTRPFYIAGGITGAAREAYGDLLSHPGFRGIDVSTGARDRTGRVCSRRRMSLLLTATTQPRASPRRASCAASEISTNGVTHRRRQAAASRAVKDPGSSSAVSRTAEAPCALAAAIWRSLVTKSFLRIGRSVSAATSRSSASSPPNKLPVTTDRHGAPRRS